MTSRLGSSAGQLHKTRTSRIPTWAYANPALGYRIAPDVIRAALNTDPVAVFRAERLNQRVEVLNSAVDAAAWSSSSDPDGSLKDLREEVCICIDVALDGHHVSAVAASLTTTGRARVEVVGAWSSPADARKELPQLVGDIRPAAIGYFVGPANVLAADLDRLGASKITDVAQACMTFAGSRERKGCFASVRSAA